MTLNAYLFFDGQCAEAFDYYKSVFGGDFSAHMTFADGPPDFQYDDAEKGKIMHVSLPVGSSVLMGSDTPKGEGEPPRPANSFSISYDASSREDADRVFAALSKGGVATMPMEETFWNAYFGSCTDRFGVQWMVSFDLGAA